jgi:chemotaxis protein MotB
MAEELVRPIIVIKRKKNAAGHHGGAWKVAYADFVTAMMAFFMVMWLVASVSKDQRAAMFEYFHNPSMEKGHSVKAAPGQAGPGGASTSFVKLGGGLDAPKTVTHTPKPAGPTVNGTGRGSSAEAKEKEQLESLLEELRKAIALGQALEPYRDQLPAPQISTRTGNCRRTARMLHGARSSPAAWTRTRLHAWWVSPPRYCSTRPSRSIPSIVASASSS